MLQASSSVKENLCTQCSYQSEWPFQLSHHVRKLHRNVNSAYIHTAMGQLFCTSFKLKSQYNKLAFSGKQARRRIDNRSKQIEDNSVWYNCNQCQLQTHSTLSLIKHLCSCCSKPNISPTEHETDPKAKTGTKLFISNKNKREYTKTYTVMRTVYMKPKRQRQQRLRSKIDLNSLVVSSHAFFKCAKCPYKTKIRSCLRQHESQHSTSRGTSLECSKCGLNTYSESALSEHIKSHILIDYSTKCPICPFRCEKLSEWKLHMLQHTAMGDLIMSKSLLENNQKRTEQEEDSKATKDVLFCEKWFVCVQCHFKTRQQFDLQTHMKSAHGFNKKFETVECAKCTSVAESVRPKVHALQHGSGENKVSVLLSCPKCPFKTALHHTLNRHMEAEHLCGIKCPMCPFQAQSRSASALNGHLLLHGKSEEHNTPNPKVKVDNFSLKTCNTRQGKNKDQESLKKKQPPMPQNVADEGRFACLRCTFRTEQEADLQTHVLSMHDSNFNKDGFTCTHCTFVTQYKSELKRHFTQHLSGRHHPVGVESERHPFPPVVVVSREKAWLKCAECTFKTKAASVLEKHFREHQLAAFKCPKCPLKVKCLSQYDMHVAVHNKLEEFKTLNAMNNLDMF